MDSKDNISYTATYESHDRIPKTKNILFVQQLLGHKNIQNTIIYIQLIETDNNGDSHSATARTVGDVRKLIESGFGYVCTHSEIMLFRKRE